MGRVFSMIIEDVLFDGGGSLSRAFGKRDGESDGELSIGGRESSYECKQRCPSSRPKAAASSHDLVRDIWLADVKQMILPTQGSRSD
jgi:hypothetical protein